MKYKCERACLETERGVTNFRNSGEISQRKPYLILKGVREVVYQAKRDCVLGVKGTSTSGINKTDTNGVKAKVLIQCCQSYSLLVSWHQKTPNKSALFILV